MKPMHSQSQSRAKDLWRHFAGMFGAESVSRKFGDEPPAEWVAEIERLKDYELERGMRRLLKSGAIGVPTLPHYTKLCRAIEDDDRPTDLPGIARDETQWDAWVVAANTHLLAHITRQASLGIHYCSTRDRTIEARPRGLPKVPDYEADARTHALTAPLVRAKNAWAKDMREWGEPPTVEEQKTHWRWHMAQADAEINELRGNP